MTRVTPGLPGLLIFFYFSSFLFFSFLFFSFLFFSFLIIFIFFFGKFFFNSFLGLSVPRKSYLNLLQVSSVWWRRLTMWKSTVIWKKNRPKDTIQIFVGPRTKILYL